MLYCHFLLSPWNSYTFNGTCDGHPGCHNCVYLGGIHTVWESSAKAVQIMGVD